MTFWFPPRGDAPPPQLGLHARSSATGRARPHKSQKARQQSEHAQGQRAGVCVYAGAGRAAFTLVSPFRWLQGGRAGAGASKRKKQGILTNVFLTSGKGAVGGASSLASRISAGSACKAQQRACDDSEAPTAATLRQSSPSARNAALQMGGQQRPGAGDSSMQRAAI